MPQEVEVWYVLPAIRRELTKTMIDKGIPQKQIAQMLGVTEPAVTQYKLSKSKRSRGDQVDIPDIILKEIDKSADIMIEEFEKARKIGQEDIFEEMTREINRIIRVMRDEGIMCDIHREFCAHTKDPCDACANK